MIREKKARNGHILSLLVTGTVPALRAFASSLQRVTQGWAAVVRVTVPRDLAPSAFHVMKGEFSLPPLNHVALVLSNSTGVTSTSIASQLECLSGFHNVCHAFSFNCFPNPQTGAEQCHGVGQASWPICVSMCSYVFQAWAHWQNLVRPRVAVRPNPP